MQVDAREAEISRCVSGDRQSRINQQRRNVGLTARTVAYFFAIMVLATVPGIGSVVWLARVAGNSPQPNMQEPATTLPANIELAQRLSRAINAGDVDTLVELFTDEDAGPTVVADRFAWGKFEIRRWALNGASMNMHMQADDYQLTEHGATWEAIAYRDDWTALGVHGLAVTDAIWVHNGKIATFTSVPRDATDIQQLGNLWRPGATPER